jgi:hypothetical protein
VRLGLVPWQVVLVILQELVASRPVLIALQSGKEVEQSKGLLVIVYLEWVIAFCAAFYLPCISGSAR